MNSFNHYTFGGCGEWMMGYLVGLRPEQPGFKVVRVEPAIVPDLQFAGGSFETPYGVVSNRWERKNSHVIMRLTVPGNTMAMVRLPITSQSLTVNGAPLPRAAHLKEIKEASPDSISLETSSGTYLFDWRE